MNYQPAGNAFSWDRVFRPTFMGRMLTWLGLRKEGIIRIVNLPQIAIVSLWFLPFFPIAWTMRLLFGQSSLQKYLYKVYGWGWLAVFGVYRRAWYHPALRRDESYVYMPEHFNLMDIPLFGTTWPTDTRALSAKEYAKIPMYGWILQTIGTHFIDRKDTQQAIKDLEALAERMEREKISALVVPTGTRSTENENPPFKKGVFHMAQKMKRPIVPIYLVGLEDIRVGKTFCGPGRVDVVYGEPMTPEKYPVEFGDAEKLLTLVRDRMQSEGRMLRREREKLIA